MKLMLEGVIVKALSGYYYVKPLENGMAALGGENAIQCRARGIFKKKGVTPLVGDHVLYSHTENGEGMVDEILPRRSINKFIRPPVANVDLAVPGIFGAGAELNLSDCSISFWSILSIQVWIQ